MEWAVLPTRSPLAVHTFDLSSRRRGPALCSVEATIHTASITTHNEQRDARLRSIDFLDTDRYPTMTFHGTAIVGSATSGLTVLGEVSIKESTRQVRVDVELNGVVTDPWGQQRVALTATTQIDREDFVSPLTPQWTAAAT